MEKIARIEGYAAEKVTEDWMDKDDTHAPQFLSQPQDLVLMENSLAHFECRLIPVGDPSLNVEWFHNGKPLTTGSRVKAISDFGFVILEVAGIMAHDAGIYTCKASNKHGEASVSAKLQVKSKSKTKFINFYHSENINYQIKIGCSFFLQQENRSLWSHNYRKNGRQAPGVLRNLRKQCIRFLRMLVMMRLHAHQSSSHTSKISHIL